MKLNVGSTDRAIRVLVGLVLIALGLFHVVTGTWAIVLYVIGAIQVITGLVRFCPVYLPFGISTARK
jgi:Inner membrane protein YgaP-like, transmembrane domain